MTWRALSRADEYTAAGFAPGLEPVAPMHTGRMTWLACSRVRTCCLTEWMSDTPSGQLPTLTQHPTAPQGA